MCTYPPAASLTKSAGSVSCSAVTGSEERVHGQEGSRRDRRPRVRGGVHPDLPGPPRRRDVRDLPAQQGRAGHRSATGSASPSATPTSTTLLKDPNVDAVHINSPIPDHASQSDRGAEGRQARRVHGADGHEHRRVPADRRRAEEERQGLHDDGDRRLQPRVPVREGAVRPRRARADPVPARQPPAGHGRLARLLAGAAADVVRDALRRRRAWRS